MWVSCLWSALLCRPPLRSTPRSVRGYGFPCPLYPRQGCGRNPHPPSVPSVVVVVVVVVVGPRRASFSSRAQRAVATGRGTPKRYMSLFSGQAPSTTAALPLGAMCDGAAFPLGAMRDGAAFPLGAQPNCCTPLTRFVAPWPQWRSPHGGAAAVWRAPRAFRDHIGSST